MVEYFDPCHPVLVGGIGLGKQKVGYMQARLKRHRWWHKKVLKSRDPTIVSIGRRRFQTVPVYAIEDRNGRHRMLKYTPEHMHCLAMFWGPLAPPQMGSCCPKFIQQSVGRALFSSNGAFARRQMEGFGSQVAPRRGQSPKKREDMQRYARLKKSEAHASYSSLKNFVHMRL